MLRAILLLGESGGLGGSDALVGPGWGQALVGSGWGHALWGHARVGRLANPRKVNCQREVASRLSEHCEIVGR